MGNAEKAVLSSFLIHALLVAGFVRCFDGEENARASPALDVSSVELSLSDAESDAQRISRSSPPSAGTEKKVSPKQESPPPAPQKPQGTPLLPDPIEIPLAGEPVVEMRVEELRGVDGEAADIPAADQAQVVSPAKLRQSIKPEYPKAARRRGEEGIVKLSVTVDAFGLVSGVSVTLSSGFESLDAAAVKAVKAAKFLPARNDDDPVASNVGLTLVFKLK